MTPLEQYFTAWADREFGPAPDPTIPQTERFASYWKCRQAAIDAAIDKAMEATSNA